MSLSSRNAAGNRHFNLVFSMSSKLVHSCPVSLNEWFYWSLFLLFPKRDVRAAVAQERILEFLLCATDVPWEAGDDSKEAPRVWLWEFLRPGTQPCTAVHTNQVFLGRGKIASIFAWYLWGCFQNLLDIKAIQLCGKNSFHFEISISRSCGYIGKFGKCKLCGWTKKWKKERAHTRRRSGAQNIFRFSVLMKFGDTALVCEPCA